MLPTTRDGDSPFLEGTCIQYSWDSVSLGALKACPRRYQLSIIEGWEPKTRGIDLTFGILYTEALEGYYVLRAQDLSHEDAVFQIVQELMEVTWVPHPDPHPDALEGHRWEHGQWDSNHNNKNFYNLLRTVIWYLDQFEHDPAETVTAEDGTPLVERSFRLELDWGPQAAQARFSTKDEDYGHHDAQPYLLCGHLDRVVSFLGATYAMDHKTTKSTVGDYYFDRYTPDNQMSLYSLAAQAIFQTPIKGVIIDAAQVAVGFSRFSRGFAYRTEAQLQEWMADLKIILSQAEGYATAGYWPMNDTACALCQFNRGQAKICAKDPSVRQAFLESHFTQESPWNPLRTRR